MEAEKAAAILAEAIQRRQEEEEAAEVLVGQMESRLLVRWWGANGLNGSQGSAGTGPPGKRRKERRGSVGTPAVSTSQLSALPPLAPSSTNINNAEDEHVDMEDDWRTSYIPLAADLIPNKTTRDRLRAHAQSWRGVVALAPSLSTSSSTSHPDVEEGEDGVHRCPTRSSRRRRRRRERRCSARTTTCVCASHNDIHPWRTPRGAVHKHRRS